ncbi:MAG: cysteine--tRNA ligase, partial [Planctomycetota bacterium]
MPISVYNSLTRQVEDLVPVIDGTVSIYVCGPTVYSDAHIGHTMGPVVFDAVARWLRCRGYRTQLVNNITDIDDKIIARSRETHEDWRALTERYTEQYLDLLAALGVETIDSHPRCSDHVEHMVAFVQELVDRNVAYPAEDGVYFDVAAYADYGKLTGRERESSQSGGRVSKTTGDLRNPEDFCLWKFAKPDEPKWPSPWGEGRPGWHIECSVMSEQLLGPEFDIHGGGDDLKFPHHENEVAQSRAAGRPFARVWMHNGLIQFQGAKVAKSDPRMRDRDFAAQFRAKHAVEIYGGPTVRFLFLQGHYRKPVEFSPRSLDAARTSLQRLHDLLGDLLDEPKALTAQQRVTLFSAERPETDPQLAPLFAPWPQASAHIDTFRQAMDQDFNTGRAIAELFTIARHARRETDPAIRRAMLLWLRELGRCIGMFRPEDAVAMRQLRPAATQSDAADATLADGLMQL